MAHDKPALMRAYKAADKTGKAKANDGFIEFDEFENLLKYLTYYSHLYKLFSQLDKDTDHRISFAEFKKGHEICGFKDAKEADLRKDFNQVDSDHGGFVRFEEFCQFMAKKHLDK